MRPFGKSLQYSLENARINTEDSDFAIWVEEDYCLPPLAMEREAVLDRDFNDITVEKVESENEAWTSRGFGVNNDGMMNQTCHKISLR
jgi:hypothetical protein